MTSEYSVHITRQGFLSSFSRWRTSHTEYSFLSTGCVSFRVPSRCLLTILAASGSPSPIPLRIQTSVGWATVKLHTSKQSMPAIRDLLQRVMSGGNTCLDTHTHIRLQLTNPHWNTNNYCQLTDTNYLPKNFFLT